MRTKEMISAVWRGYGELWRCGGGPASRSSGRRGSLPEHWQLLREGPGFSR